LHPGYYLLYQLEAGYRLAELVPLFSIVNTGIEATLRHTNGTSSNEQPCCVNTDKGILKATAYLAYDILLVNAAIAKCQVGYVSSPVTNHLNTNAGKAWSTFVNGNES
jgi:hypothetical protein